VLRHFWIRPFAPAALALFFILGPAAHSDEGASARAGRVPVPAIETPAGKQCVRDAAFMRRNHMQLLMHQRQETVHQGIRPENSSLQACIACHANPKTQRVTGKDGFCENCHRYAAVSIDCFTCHADSPKKASASAPATASSAARLSDVIAPALAASGGGQ
jgi:hypothetical protein